jgi:hypothetical protein
MKIYADLRHEVHIDPIDVIEKLKTGFLGDHHRWVEKKDDKFYVMGDCYHNSTEIIKEITAEDIEYLDALEIIEKYLKNG